MIFMKSRIHKSLNTFSTVLAYYEPSKHGTKYFTFIIPLTTHNTLVR